MDYADAQILTTRIESTARTFEASVAAYIECEGLKATNLARQYVNFAPAYGEDDFHRILLKYGLI